MYLIINNFAFEHPKTDILDHDIINTLKELGNLFINLKKINVELITHSTLSQVELNSKSLREYIKSIEDTNTRQALISLIGKIKPICSDTDTAFESKDKIAFGNCQEEVEKIDICYTFLSCALYHLNPILTINTLCSKKQFFNEEIKISCDEGIYNLQNYQLHPYEKVIEKLKEHQKDQLEDQYNTIDEWNDYKEFINKNFKYCKITDSCIENLEKNFSYNNSYSTLVRKKIKKMNTLIQEKNGDIMGMDFSSLGLGTPESDTRKKALKSSHKGIQNFSNEDVFLDWHDYIQKDFRIYFDKSDSYVSFVYFGKKIE